MVGASTCGVPVARISGEDENLVVSLLKIFQFLYNFIQLKLELPVHIQEGP